eukprot:Selendium_serpulae@DN2671_c0_g1_i1.p1
MPGFGLGRVGAVLLVCFFSLGGHFFTCALKPSSNLRTVSAQRRHNGRGKFKVLTFFSSNFGEMTSNWWHYLRPYAEECDVDVIAVAYSEGLCDLIPPHKISSVNTKAI